MMIRANGGGDEAGLRRRAQAYIEGALKMQAEAGSPSQVSKQDYDAAVERAEASLRDVVRYAA